MIKPWWNKENVILHKASAKEIHQLWFGPVEDEHAKYNLQWLVLQSS